MILKKINTDKAPAAIGPYSQGWMADDTIYVSGQLGIDMETGKIADGIEAQAHASMKNLGAILSEVGSDYAHIMKTTIFLQNMSDFAVVNKVYGSYFGDEFPARSCFEVGKLPLDGLVEIECIAVKVK